MSTKDAWAFLSKAWSAPNRVGGSVVVVIDCQIVHVLQDCVELLEELNYITRDQSDIMLDEIAEHILSKKLVAWNNDALGAKHRAEFCAAKASAIPDHLEVGQEEDL